MIHKYTPTNLSFIIAFGFKIKPVRHFIGINTAQNPNKWDKQEKIDKVAAA
jgi:hypothetical protein